MKYTEDRVINYSTPKYPGPWIGKQRVYRLKKHGEDNWFTIQERVYDNTGLEVPSSMFLFSSALCGTREWLQLQDDEPILQVKKLPSL